MDVDIINRLNAYLNMRELADRMDNNQPIIRMSVITPSKNSIEALFKGSDGKLWVIYNFPTETCNLPISLLNDSVLYQIESAILNSILYGNNKEKTKTQNE